MKIAEHLSKDEKNKLSQIKSPKKKTKHKKQPKQKEEKIDWHDLMGSNNRGLRRGKGGALKRS